MIDRDAIARVTSPDFVGTYHAEVTDESGAVQIRLGVRGEVIDVRVLRLDFELKSEDGLRSALIQAMNRAEGNRVFNELALCGALDNVSPSDDKEALAPLPGPTAPPLVIRPYAEQADAFARYVSSGGLDGFAVTPGLRWGTSENTFLSLGFDERGQLQAVRADAEWLRAVTEQRLNNSLSQALEAAA